MIKHKEGYKRLVKKVGVFLAFMVLLLAGNSVTANAQSPQKLSTSGYKHGMLNNFRVDAVDPDYVDGDFVNQFLDYYPKSRLRGHGDVIVKMADKHGINIVAYLGQIAKETTFGSATCGGQYNFGCYMWAEWMGVSKIGPSTGHTNYDRDWANPSTVEQGIEIQMVLIRNNYINKGYYYYPDYLERYSPAFENDHVSFGSLMYGVAKSFGQDINTKDYKVPGGMASQAKLPTPKLEVFRHEEVTNEQVKALFTHVDIAKVELLAYADTTQLTDKPVTTKVYVEFKDGTVKEGQVEVTVKPRKVKVKVINADTLAEEVHTLTEGKGVEVDVAGIIDSNKPYTATQTYKDVLTYYSYKKKKEGFEVVQSDILENKFIKQDIEGDQTIYLLTELEEEGQPIEIDYEAVDKLLAERAA